MRLVICDVMVAVAALGASCAAKAAGPDASHVPGVVELGTGSATWTPIVNEQQLGLVTGPQGGHHFIVNARMHDLAPGDPQHPGVPADPYTTFAAFEPTGAGETQIDLMNPPFRLGYADGDGDGWPELPSGRILQLQEPFVPGVPGMRIHLVVTIKDKDGKMASDERFVIARPMDQLLDAGVPDAQ